MKKEKRERRCDEWLRNSKCTPHRPCTSTDVEFQCSSNHTFRKTLCGLHYRHRLLNGRPEKKKEKRFGFHSEARPDSLILRDYIPLGVSVTTHSRSTSVCAGCYWHTLFDRLPFLHLGLHACVCVCTNSHMCALDRIWAIFGAEEVVGKKGVGILERLLDTRYPKPLSLQTRPWPHPLRLCN